MKTSLTLNDPLEDIYSQENGKDRTNANIQVNRHQKHVLATA